MPFTRNVSTPRITTVATLVAATLMLGGCFSNPIDEVVDQIDEAVAGEAAADAPADDEQADAIEVEVEDSDGEVGLTSGNTVPDGFPAEVPYIDGRIIVGQVAGTGDNKLWSLGIAVDDVEAAFAEQVELVRAEGFEPGLDSPDGLLKQFSKDGLALSVSASELADGQPMVMVQVQSTASDDGSSRPEDGANDADTDNADAVDGDIVCEDGDAAARAEIPNELAELSVPFYPCLVEMSAIPGSDPLFVGEYDTDHPSVLVEAEILLQFEGSDWEVTSRANEGDNTITQAEMPGYSLVVVVGPSRMPDAESSVHYTLRPQ